MNDLLRGFSSQREELEAALLGVAHSGWYVHGPEHEAFQREFADFVGVGHCVGVASGTDALELAIRAVGEGRDGTVLTAANAGGYTTTAARCAGREVSFADVDPVTLCLSAGSVEPLLDGVAICVVTHLYGRLAPIEQIVELCHDHGVVVIEDCAQSVGAERGGRRAGSFADAATFSFYPTKNLGALGDGGAVVTSDAELAASLLRLRQYGWTSKYSVGVDGGRNSRLDEMQAAVLRTRLPHVPGWNERRRDIIKRYAAAAAGTDLTILAAEGEDHAGHLAVGLTPRREEAVASLAAAGVRTDVHYPTPDHRQPAFADEFDQVSLPITEESARQLISLPCFPELTDAEIEQVCDALRNL
ncbi:MAG: aminotransferase class V-fold PLP-dependent enzyme [Actinobacteria bacterium]|nr:aminotransferase class V-fold PLP-dependent enzyme [Actinomycetota bacterium]